MQEMNMGIRNIFSSFIQYQRIDPIPRYRGYNEIDLKYVFMNKHKSSPCDKINTLCY